MNRLIIVLFLISSFNAHAIETCSRVAQVNYQEILIDAGKGKRAEGLRFYLDKDPKSKKLLDEYQQKSEPSILAASASTIGSLMIFSALIKTGENNSLENTNRFLLGGTILVATSYLFSKTLQYQSEKILENSINEYNKRNRPIIYFSPYKDSNDTGIGFGVQKGF